MTLKKYLTIIVVSLILLFGYYFYSKLQSKSLSSLSNTNIPVAYVTETISQPMDQIDESIVDRQAIISAFIQSDYKLPFEDEGGCTWKPFISSADEIVPGKVVQINGVIRLIGRKGEKCLYKVGDGYPSEGQLLLATKTNGKWMFIKEPIEMCPFLKNIPKAKDLLASLYMLYGVCK